MTIFSFHPGKQNSWAYFDGKSITVMTTEAAKQYWFANIQSKESCDIIIYLKINCPFKTHLTLNWPSGNFPQRFITWSIRHALKKTGSALMQVAVTSSQCASGSKLNQSSLCTDSYSLPEIDAQVTPLCMVPLNKHMPRLSLRPLSNHTFCRVWLCK